MNDACSSQYRPVSHKTEIAFSLALLLVMLTSPWSVAGQATPAASPSAGCSPIRSDVASPVASPSVTQSTAARNRADVVLAMENLIACRNAEVWEVVADLMLPALLLEQFGVDHSGQGAELMSSLHDAGFFGSLDLVTAGEPAVSTNFASIAVTTQEGYVFRREEWQFRRPDTRWLLSTILPMSPLLTINAVGIPITLDERGLSTTRSNLTNPGAVVFDLVNATDQPQSFAVFQAPATLTLMEFAATLRSGAADPGLVIGWEVVPAGETRDIALLGLPDGTYAIVAGFDPRIAKQNFEDSAVIQIAIQR